MPELPPASSTAISSPEKAARGQFFTRSERVARSMLSLLTHSSGTALEPSAGAGHLVRALESLGRFELTAWELDSRLDSVCDTEIVRGDFFALADAAESDALGFDVVFGNPPYVAWKAVEAATRTSSSSVKAEFSDKANLYHLFIHRSIDLLAPGGELVLIVPKEWLYATSAAPLRTKLAREGAITHLVDCGEEKLFADASVPALLIFRFVRGAAQESVCFFASLDDHLAGRALSRTLVSDTARWMLLTPELGEQVKDWGRLGDQLSVRVGLVTGLDAAFRLMPSQRPEPECVQAQAGTDRTLHRFLNLEHVEREEDIPPRAAAHLAPWKSQLLARRIRRFDESNWWRYGAVRNQAHMDSSVARVFALAKTRSSQPFFALAGAQSFAGGVLGLFQTPDATITPIQALPLLNSPRFRPLLEALFLTSNDKVSLQPATLEDVPFPASLEQLEAFLD